MDTETLHNRMYLGDGVYVGHDGYQAWLYTDNGIAVTNKIALEPEVIDGFIKWLNQTKGTYTHGEEQKQ